MKTSNSQRSTLSGRVARRLVMLCPAAMFIVTIWLVLPPGAAPRSAAPAQAAGEPQTAAAAMATAPDSQAVPPSALSVLLLRARYWRDQQQFDQALVSLDRALSLAPDSAEALTLLAEVQAAIGNVAAADAARARLSHSIANATAASPAVATPVVPATPSKDTLLAEAQELARAGKTGEALQRYDAALQGIPPPAAFADGYYKTLAGSPDGLDRLASLTQDPATPPQATQAWRRALLALPDAPESAAPINAYLARHPADGEVAAKLNARQQPQPLTPPAATAEADTAEAATAGGLGLLKLREKKLDEAKRLLARAMQLDPAHQTRWQPALAAASAPATAAPPAIAAAKPRAALRVPAAAPASASAPIAAAPAVFDNQPMAIATALPDDDARATSLAGEARLRRHPGDPEAWRAAISEALLRGDREAAGVLLRDGLIVSPNEPSLWVQSAELAEAYGDVGRAMRDLRRARELRTQQLGETAAGDPAASLAVPPLLQAEQAAPFTPQQITAAGRPPAYQPSATERPPQRGLLDLHAAPITAPVAGSRLAPAANDPLTREIDSSMALLQGLTPPSGAQTAEAASAEAAPAVAADKNEHSAPALGLQTGVTLRARDGNSSLDRLGELAMPLEASYSRDGFGRLKFSAIPTALYGSAPNGAAQRFGSTALGMAGSAAGRQSAEGVGLALAFSVPSLTVDAGTTPLGFRTENVVGGVNWTPQLSDHARLQVSAERRAVTDSVLSYAGAADPRTGEVWGGVTRARGGLKATFDVGPAEIYASGGFSVLTGTHVQNNTGFDLGAGGSLPVYKTSTQELRAGLDLIYFGYKNNARYYTFGQGGYFSPQSYMAAMLPVTYRYQVNPDLSYEASAAVGLQTFREGASPYFPADASLQAQLAAQQANPATAVPGAQTAYSARRQTGVAGNAHLSADYRVSAGLHLGAELDYARMGDFDSARAILFARYLFNTPGQP